MLGFLEWLFQSFMKQGVRGKLLMFMRNIQRMVEMLTRMRVFLAKRIA